MEGRFAEGGGGFVWCCDVEGTVGVPWRVGLLRKVGGGGCVCARRGAAGRLWVVGVVGLFVQTVLVVGGLGCV